MFSVNQLAVYHNLLEAYNILRNSASEQIQRKWTNKEEKKYPFRNIKDLKVPIKPMLKCKGFTYSASKLYNLLPMIIKEAKNPNTFKNLTKEWIWKNIPSR